MEKSAIHRDYKLLRQMIIDSTKWTDEIFDEKEAKYLKYFEGIVDKEGILYILCHESKFLIQDFDDIYTYKHIPFAQLPNHIQDTLTVKAEVLSTKPTRKFFKEDRTIKISTIYVRDSNILQKIVFWNDLTELFDHTNFKKNMLYKFTNVKIVRSEKENNNIVINITGKTEILECKKAKELPFMKITDLFTYFEKGFYRGFFNLKGVIVIIKSDRDKLKEVEFRDNTGGILIKFWGNSAEIEFPIPSIVELKNVALQYDSANEKYPIIGHLNDVEDIRIVKRTELIIEG